MSSIVTRLFSAKLMNVVFGLGVVIVALAVLKFIVPLVGELRDGERKLKELRETNEARKSYNASLKKKQIDFENSEKFVILTAHREGWIAKNETLFDFSDDVKNKPFVQ